MNGSHTGPMNIGNPDEFTIRRWRACPCAHRPDLPLIEKPLPADDPPAGRWLDLAQRELGWSPTISLENGLIPTIEFRSVLDQQATQTRGVRA